MYPGLQVKQQMAFKAIKQFGGPLGVHIVPKGPTL
jgi:hypothetical protein